MDCAYKVVFPERIMSVAWPPERRRNSPYIKAGRLLPLRGEATKADRRPSHLRQSELLPKLHDSILVRRPPPATACLTLRSGTIRADPML
jgi:hypothetical protein